MMKFFRAARAAVPFALALSALAAAPASAQTASPAASGSGQNQTVNISDSGFTPATLTVPVGTTITWVNQGGNVHTATSTPIQTANGVIATPAPFDSGGLGNGQSFQFQMNLPGTYQYTSATDCLNGNATPGFTCAGYSIVVGAPSGPAGAPPTSSAPASPAASIGPAPAPAGTTVTQHANINVSDSGFTPGVVAVATGGIPTNPATVTFTNIGTQIHTAVSGQVHTDSQSTAPEIFDTGGLAPGASQTFSFVYPGIYQYNSATDCLNGNNNPQFNCGGPYTIQVVRAAVGADVTTVAPPFSGAIVYFRDPAGFDPSTLTIKRGQMVTWLNLSKTPHSVVSESDSPLSYDSGGLGVGSIFSVTYTQPGTYRYHSSTDAAGQYSGTVVVQP